MKAGKLNRAWVARLLWSLSSVIALLLVIKLFVADVYHITSESMRPTLFGGSSRGETEVFSEWVLVRYDNDYQPQRFDLVVVRRDGQPSIVKRVLGLPGESVRIVDGDVFINGERLGYTAKRPAPIPVFDDSLHAVSDMHGIGFCVEERPLGPWHVERGVWYLEGAELAGGRDSGRSTGMMFYNPDVRDGYIDQKGKRIAGNRSVNDVVLSCELALDLLKDRLRLQLTEAGDLFEARIRPNPNPGPAHIIELIRNKVGSIHAGTVEDLESVEASLEIDFPMGEWVQFELSNIDNCVSLKCLKLELELFFCYEANVRFPGKAPVGDQNVGIRVGLGGEGLEARFRSIKVLRDMHYTTLPNALSANPSESPNREEALLFLGPGELFLLGDNSSFSIDSRNYGAVPASDVVGRPVAVVWPFGRQRSL